MNPETALTTAEYRTALRNASGSRPSLFVPETAFETLIRQQIERLREPSLQCAELVLNELLRIVTQLESKVSLSCFQILSPLSLALER